MASTPSRKLTDRAERTRKYVRRRKERARRAQPRMRGSLEGRALLLEAELGENGERPQLLAEDVAKIDPDGEAAFAQGLVAVGGDGLAHGVGGTGLQAAKEIEGRGGELGGLPGAAGRAGSAEEAALPW